VTATPICDPACDGRADLLSRLREMADLERSTGPRMTRRQRERRAYQLTLATGALAVVAVAGIVLAAVGVIGAGLPILALILAVVSGLLLRRTLGL
jgi:hypothetical protein